jgi:hypothetical protein
MAKRKTVKSKVVKKKAAKKELVKNKGALAGKDKAEVSDILGTIMDSDGKPLDVEKKHIDEIDIPPVCIVGSGTLDDESREALSLKFYAVKMALKSNSKNLQDRAIDTMLGDLVVGAYQDKLTVYQIERSEHSQNSFDVLKETQRVRRAADMHLLNIITAVKDIKRPPVSVVVKEAEQVNVAEQINQGDKQVNIGKQQANIGRD